MIALNNQINAAREVTKSHTSDVETFKSGDYGFLGNADDDRVIFCRAPLRRQHVPLKTHPTWRLSRLRRSRWQARESAVDGGANGIALAARTCFSIFTDTFGYQEVALSRWSPDASAYKTGDAGNRQTDP